MAASALAGLAVLLVVGGVAGLVAAAAVAALGPRLLARLEPEATRRDRERLAADLPLALDLLAACLAGGASLPRAASVVAEAVGGPVGRRLQRVGAALDLGTPAEEAWAGLVLRGVACPEDDPLAPVARTLARAARGGAPVVAAVERLAAEARADLRARGEQAARRAGVLAVGPLGLCFLPAFVLIGVVPIVVGLVGPLLSSV